MADKDLGKRMAYWAVQLGQDKRFPWVGTAIIEDLNKAAKMLGADPEKMFPKPEPVSTEYDL